MAKRVLVVEDNELNLKLFCDLLKAHGYETVPTRDGREVLELVRAERPDLIVMDIQLPHVSGLDVIRRSEEHTSELQSLMRISYAVFCLKKTQIQQAYNIIKITIHPSLSTNKRKSSIIPHK